MAKANQGVGRLLSAMKRLVVEVNDQEICRRLEILMASEKQDLALATIRSLLESPATFDPRSVPEPYTQYVKHYLYMVKREGRTAGEASRPRAKRTPRKPSAKAAGG